MNSVIFLCSLVPSAVENVTVGINGSGVVVTWDRPLSPNGVLEYAVTLRQEDLATPENTFLPVNGTTQMEEIFFGVETFPYFNYTADVIPSTGAGMGETTSGFFTTPQDSECHAVLNRK